MRVQAAHTVRSRARPSSKSARSNRLRATRAQSLRATGFRLGVRRQLATQDENGIDLTVGFGVGRAAFDPPAEGVFSTIRVDHFSRWNFDVPVTVGQHGSGYRWWAGPRIVYSAMSQDMNLDEECDLGTANGQPGSTCSARVVR
jgi:hypothetical protein